ncbi:MAG: inositol monophosphatase family protein [Spirochaetales bacterium]|nr:inositol monophosphatase family protein [Spirochaetales bacterium]
MTEMRSKLDILAGEIRRCGDYARRMQTKIHRTYKPDGTVLTETDLQVTNTLVPLIKELFPDCNIVTEEELVGPLDSSAPWTFVLDPIDGTDTYSQGLPCWCVGLGILDNLRRPAGSIVYAPRFGRGCDELFLRTDPGETVIHLNGEVLDVSEITVNRLKDTPHAVTGGSDIIRTLPIAKAGVKLRSFGCSIVHIACAVVFCGIDGCLDPPCYVWDIAPAHALAERAGMRFQYWTGEEFSYDDNLLVDRRKFPKPLVIGTDPWREEIIRRLNG